MVTQKEDILPTYKGGRKKIIAKGLKQSFLSRFLLFQRELLTNRTNGPNFWICKNTHNPQKTSVAKSGWAKSNCIEIKKIHSHSDNFGVGLKKMKLNTILLALKGV